MEKGFNSDVIHIGVEHHVQTEDWGFENPFIVSRVFRHGAVVMSIKTGYVEIIQPEHLRDPEQRREMVKLALRHQHEQILDLLSSGQLFRR
jgi:hypothetical protein